MKKNRSGAWWAVVGAGSLALISAHSKGLEYDTVMLRPGQKPEGDGWEPMDAVEDTSIYGALKGKPRAMVVWKRRTPLTEPGDKPEKRSFFSVRPKGISRVR